MEKYKSYGTLSKTTNFSSVFCGVGVFQQCTEAQAGVVKEELISVPDCGTQNFDRLSWLGSFKERATVVHLANAPRATI